jgi:HTH-type transcriptional regulator/antitoxin HigA
MSAATQFTPDYAIHPGEILEETLEARGMKKSDFAERCGISPKTVSLIIAGKAPVLPEMALTFEKVLGVTSSVWTGLNTTYELFEARKSEEALLAMSSAWVKGFPLTAMVKRGWISAATSAADKARRLLEYFGVGSVEAWETQFGRLQVAYRRSPSFESTPHAVAAWLRRGEMRAAEVAAAPYDAAAFQSALEQIRACTTQPPATFEPLMKQLCAEVGVAVVFVGELPGTNLSGAARWLNKDKALIQLSLRHKSNDHFWFSFFHEAGHILKHSKKALYLDDTKSGNTDLEDEANRFASEALIPGAAYRRFVAKQLFTATKVERFANEIGIAPGIVIGRLQHDGHIPYANRLNSLKQKLELVENVG